MNRFPTISSVTEGMGVCAGHAPGGATNAGTESQPVRAPAEAQDDALHERTFKWLARLPAELRPMATGRAYPRIVNRIADLWGHCEYTRLYFQSLLVDRRPGRRGFPPVVRRELEALQGHYFVQHAKLPAPLWDAVPVRPPRIPQRVFPYSGDPVEIEIRPL